MPNWFERNILGKKELPIEIKSVESKKVDKIFPSTTGKSLPVTPGRSSVPNTNSFYANLGKKKSTLDEAWYLPIIPQVRNLVKTNPDIGQALNNTVSLGNTGHYVKFDPSVKPEVVAKMRKHLVNKEEEWASGLAGMDGLINRMISQALIGGALSNEWVINNSLTGIESVILVNPEDIRWQLNAKGTKYLPFQAPKNFLGTTAAKNDGLIPLNPNTYKYYALNGDEEIPYGFPPYLASLRGIETQTNMLDNIDFIISQLGIMGFIEILIDKPEMQGDEKVEAYATRLANRLTEAKDRLKDGLKEGAVVGYKDSHEINFNSISRDFGGVATLFEQNELMIASGCNTDASLLGRGYASSETQITIVFTKLLSELKNIQNLVRHNLKFGYSLELRLAGFQFDYLDVVFRRSTLQDELKYQQAQEIKQRVQHNLRVDGIIDQTQYANEMGLEEPAEEEPIVPFENQSGNSDPNKKLNDKNDSERKTTDKKNPQGTVKKQNPQT